jgi:hypothetical protein
MQCADLVSLTNRLLWGSAATRRELAEHLLSPERQQDLVLLADTVRSGEAWRLRARCLEVLGMAAGEAGQEVAEHILQLVAMRETTNGT